MQDTIFVGLDVHEAVISVAVTPGERGGQAHATIGVDDADARCLERNVQPGIELRHGDLPHSIHMSGEELRRLGSPSPDYPIGTARSSTPWAKPRPSSKSGAATITPSGHTVLWDGSHPPRKPSSRWTGDRSCTNNQTGQLAGGRSVVAPGAAVISAMEERLDSDYGRQGNGKNSALEKLRPSLPSVYRVRVTQVTLFAAWMAWDADHPPVLTPVPSSEGCRVAPIPHSRVSPPQLKWLGRFLFVGSYTSHT